MLLVYFITSRCNFACTFCSANKMIKDKSRQISEPDLSDSSPFVQYVKTFRPTSVNLMGGEPLLVSPQFYKDLLKFLEDIDLKGCTVRLTSNLWDFHLHPDKWKDILSDKRISVCTSWNPDNSRRLGNGTVYDKETFKKVFNEFRDLTGETPGFISVISDKNCHQIPEVLEVAKELKTSCRINPVLPQGRSDDYYPTYKVMKDWIKIIKDGNEMLEDNCLIRGAIGCPFDINCGESMRCITCYNNGDVVVSACESQIPEARITNWKQEIEEKRLISPYNEDDFVLKPSCYACELFTICNACKFKVKATKEKGLIEEHCKGMQEIKKDVLDLWVHNVPKRDFD